MHETDYPSDAGSRPESENQSDAFTEIDRALRYLIEQSDGYGRIELIVHAGTIREVVASKRVKIAV